MDSHTLDQISVVTWVTQHMIFVFVGAWLEPSIHSREIIMLITIGDKTLLLGTMISHLLLGIFILSDTGKFNFVLVKFRSIPLKLRNHIDTKIILKRLLPYLYTLIYDAHTTGDTVVRPLMVEFHNDHQDCFRKA